MWNWKLIFEDEAIASYCDFDKVIDTEGDGDGTFASMECYQQTPPRFAVWASLIFKKKETVKHYIDQRKNAGLSVQGYQKFRYSLCLIEMDIMKKKYRIIPAVDYDTADHELETSAILGDKDTPLIQGLKTEWAAISSRATHTMIPAIFKKFLVQYSQ